MNKVARAVTKWTKACDKRLARVISYIHHTCEYRQYCYVGNTAQQCRLGLFQDSDFAGDLEDSKSTSLSCIFGSQTFVPRSWMCKKQTSVSHSSPEAEIVSLRRFARDLAELQGNMLRSTTLNMRNQIPTKHINLDLTDVDHVPSSVKHSGSSAMLYVFEDTEAVMKMIIKGPESHNETCIKDPQSCFGLVV